MYYKVSEKIRPNGKAEYEVTECEGDMPRTSTARIEGGRSVMDRYFVKSEEAQHYAETYNAAEQGDLEPLLAAANEGLEGRIGKSKLKIARESTGMSQSQLAEASRVGLRILQVYEQRVRSPKLDALLKLSLALNCLMSDIVEDEELSALLKRYEDRIKEV